jgi:hypothetical protein
LAFVSVPVSSLVPGTTLGSLGPDQTPGPPKLQAEHCQMWAVDVADAEKNMRMVLTIFLV